MKKNLWDTSARSYDKRFRKIYSPLFRVLLPLFQITDEVIEVGCGSGLVSFEIIPKVKSIVGYDYSTEMIKKANEKLQNSTFKNILFKIGDAMNLMDTILYDKVLLVNILHIVDHPKEILQKAMRVCKPTGEIIVISFCHGEKMAIRYKILSSFMKVCSKLGFMQKMHRFTFNQLHNLAEECGYSVIHEEHISEGFPFTLLVLKIR